MGRQQDARHLRRKAKKNNLGTAALAVCLVLLVLLAGAVIGRYQHQIQSDSSARALEFYFTSDFLDGGTHTLAPGSTAVSFTLGNHADELRFSEVDISYTVTVTHADGTPASGVKVDGVPATLAKDQIQDSTVTITGLTPGTYTVTATGKGGYEKTLTATLEVLDTESAVYKYLDTSNSAYVLLTVWAQGYQGDVTIQPPAGLIPDNTDLVMGSVKTGAEFTDTTSFSSNGYCSHTYRFFGGGVTADKFAVTYGSGQAATVKAPN